MKMLDNKRIVSTMGRLVEFFVKHELQAAEENTENNANIVTWNVFMDALVKRMEEFNADKIKINSVETIGFRERDYTGGTFDKCKSVVVYQRLKQHRGPGYFSTHTYQYIQLVFDEKSQSYGMIEEQRIQNIIDLSIPNLNGNTGTPFVFSAGTTTEKKIQTMISDIFNKLV